MGGKVFLVDERVLSCALSFQLRESILDNYDNRRTAPDIGRMCADDLDLLRSWRWDRNISVEYESFLTDQGWSDLKLLARREKDRFNEVFNWPYDKQRYLVSRAYVVLKKTRLELNDLVFVFPVPSYEIPTHRSQFQSVCGRSVWRRGV